MASQLRNPLIIIIIAIIAAVIIISSLGEFEAPSPEGLNISNLALEKDRIKMGENTTLTVEIENTADTSKVFELRIMYTAEDFVFYNTLTGEQLTDIKVNPNNYTLTHPTKGVLDKKTTIPITVQGPQPMGSEEEKLITVLVYSIDDNVASLSDERVISITVTFN
jgi:DNA-directed RNA polymerase subunit L